MLKRGQVTIFIIVAILLVVVILGSLFFIGGKEVTMPKEVSPEQFIRSCVRDAVQDKIQVALDSGGVITPQQSVVYQGEEYSYLCYQADYYQRCYNLYPALESSIEDYLVSSTQEEMRNCFAAMKDEFEAKGFSVSQRPVSYAIDLLPGFAKITLRNEVVVSDGETSQTFERFDTRELTPLYDLLQVTREIVNAESRFCFFEHTGYMLLYPELDIDRIDFEESRLYVVRKRDGGGEFKFAVRSCAIKPSL